ncbi:MAG: polysaccharide biosynthesis protein [Deltaproteobacteria bacterium]|nr:MAG: polysaccharide biosynthesis protein [Deltaproteobacteria bacterium]
MGHGTSLLLRHRAAITTLFNLTLATAAWVLAFALRFDLSVPERYVPVVLALLPVLLGCKLAGFAAFRLSKGWWRHVSIRDLEDIVRGNVLASTLFLASVVFVRGLAGFPRSVFLLDLLVSTVLMAGVRVGIRLVREQRRRAGAPEITTLALIVGAGSAGIRLLGEIESRRRLRLAVVGFVDDDLAKVGLRVCGTPVLGRIDDLPALVAEHEVGEVLIAIPSASPALLRRVVQHCTEARVRHRVLPTLSELVEGSVIYTQMREVKVDDLLAREPVQLDAARVHSLVTGKTVLVTGAAGSIGSELCRQLAAHEPERLILYDRHENGVFVLEMELQARFPRVPLVPVLGTVLLEDQLRTVFAAHRPDLVFHAAAYKHLPMAERNVLETIRNNVIGTRNVAQAAIEHGAQEFILVSTDKAVLPTSIMGATKRAAEMIVQELGDRGCRFVAVRFGNVLGSSGSVVPLFREQIARGGPVTVTDPEVTRYFMTIPEAVQLILQAASLGRGGEIFILDMGQPVRILDLARQMIRLSGFEPDEDIPIRFIGLRPGEKLHEELMTAEEEVAATQHDRIKVVRASGLQTWPDIWLPRLQACVERGDVRAALKLLQTIIPAYRPSTLLATEMHAPEVASVDDRRAASIGMEPPAPQRPPADRARLQVTERPWDVARR